MPQMAPLSWLTLFIIFSITLIVFNTLNYFSYFPHKKSTLISNQKNKTNSLQWKW
uniref:ATP synthase complex subunit 8 n=1 Tax=Metalimnobia quadrinotata TaxID=2719075 RepID=A0A7D7AA53_9DIPT|nr:ATP synthase F0 subunit 8 [Metalimnobia quadrinotata]